MISMQYKIGFFFLSGFDENKTKNTYYYSWFSLSFKEFTQFWIFKMSELLSGFFKMSFSDFQNPPKIANF